ncbi:MAG: translocation/assembly module TamB, partial [Acidobacteria bacterium]|nr:translocation/assembly module TamB [Acidobacteriota bacterium]
MRTPQARTGFLAGMQFDIQVETAPDIIFQSSLAQGVQLEANLRLRGTATNPALLGRVVILQGEIQFFGTKYTIDQGSVNFYNPVRIEPVLNIDLQTRARGIDVILTVSGTLNKLTITPRSDPPLQFSEIVALLTTGSTPSVNPTTVQTRESTIYQSWQQMGASALLGQALANPVSGRLQRFFGVTRLKIDPLISGVENNPQARLTIEQQITPAVPFTYIPDVTRTNP